MRSCLLLYENTTDLYQMQYFLREGYVSAVNGSSELFLFDVDSIILNWNFADGDFTFIDRRECLRDLGNITFEQFVDTLLLSGGDLIPALPQLSGRSKGNNIKAATDMILTRGGSGMAVCHSYRDDPNFQALNYMDRYQRSKLIVKHGVVMTKDGKVEPFQDRALPGDAHAFLGHVIPDEILYYMTKGLIGSRMLNWLASAELVVRPPLDSGDTTEYQRFVRDQLSEIRNSTISLIAYSMHRYYQHAKLSIRFWFDRENPTVLDVNDLPDPRGKVKQWNVRESEILQRKEAMGLKTNNFATLGFAVRSLGDENFCKQTVTVKDPKKACTTTKFIHPMSLTVLKPLETKTEILCNALWRLLQLRGYVDDQHLLTSWGEILVSVMNAVESVTTPDPESKARLEEGAFLVVELARLNLLHDNSMFAGYGGEPARGTGSYSPLNLDSLADYELQT